MNGTKEQMRTRSIFALERLLQTTLTPELKSFIVSLLDIISESLNHKNAIQILKISVQYKLDELRDFVLDFIAKDFDTFYSFSEIFEFADKRLVKALLSRSDLKYDEISMYIELSQWVHKTNEKWILDYIKLPNQSANILERLSLEKLDRESALEAIVYALGNKVGVDVEPYLNIVEERCSPRKLKQEDRHLTPIQISPLLHPPTPGSDTLYDRERIYKEEEQHYSTSSLDQTSANRIAESVKKYNNLDFNLNYTSNDNIVGEDINSNGGNIDPIHEDRCSEDFEPHHEVESNEGDNYSYNEDQLQDEPNDKHTQYNEGEEENQEVYIVESDNPSCQPVQLYEPHQDRSSNDCADYEGYTFSKVYTPPSVTHPAFRESKQISPSIQHKPKRVYPMLFSSSPTTQPAAHSKFSEQSNIDDEELQSTQTPETPTQYQSENEFINEEHIIYNDPNLNEIQNFEATSFSSSPKDYQNEDDWRNVERPFTVQNTNDETNTSSKWSLLDNRLQSFESKISPQLIPPKKNSPPKRASFSSSENFRFQRRRSPTTIPETFDFANLNFNSVDSSGSTKNQGGAFANPLSKFSNQLQSPSSKAMSQSVHLDSQSNQSGSENNDSLKPHIVEPTLKGLNTHEMKRDIMTNLRDVVIAPPLKNLKIIIVGDSHSGKTTWVKRYLHEDVTHPLESTIGVQVDHSTIHTSEGFDINFEIWDVSGGPFSGLRDGYYFNADGAIIFFDVCDEKSRKSIVQWKKEIMQVCGTDIPFVVVGNKIDLATNRKIFLPHDEPDAFLEMSVKSDHIQTMKIPLQKLAQQILLNSKLKIV